MAGFYREFMSALESAGIDVKIWPMPVEVPNPIRFDQDVTHARYDRAYAHRFWRILVTLDTIFKEFRARFIGKASPVQFFWGTFDMAVTRFSGRRAPERPGADIIAREASSHEEISAGWWPGSGDIAAPAFYAYALPEPGGFRESPVQPKEAFYDAKLGEFLLLYDEVRRVCRSQGYADGLPREHLRCRSDARQMGPRRARKTGAMKEAGLRASGFTERPQRN